MTYKNIGIISLIYGILGVISSLIRIVLTDDYDINIITIFFDIISAVFYTIILIKFKSFINEKFKDYSIDNLIFVFIGTSGILLIMDFIFLITGLNINDAGIELILFLIISIIFMGVVTIIYSFKLKKIKNKGSFKIYANLELASGIFLLTIIGINIGLLLSSIGFICLYFILKSKNEIKEDTRSNRIEVPVSTKSKELRIDDYYNSLKLEEYNSLKARVLVYLPKNLSDEEIKKLIKDYISKEIIK